MRERETSDPHTMYGLLSASPAEVHACEADVDQMSDVERRRTYEPRVIRQSGGVLIHPCNQPGCCVHSYGRP
eukprot:1214319-Pyramimonas_sp.AAC.1